MFATLRAMAACAVAVVSVSLVATPAEAFKQGAYHIMPTRAYAAYLAKIGRAPSASAGPMLYYGGSVFPSGKVVSVIWGKKVNSTTVAGIPGFSAAMVNSTYVDQLSQYDTFLKSVDGRHGTMQHILRGTFLGQIQIAPKNTSMQLTDADVQSELRYQIRIGALPPNDLDTLYMVYFPVNITITLDGLTSCMQFGAYHFAINDTRMGANNLFYSVEPDCHSSFGSITFAASHEFVEATTDNIPTPGSNPAFPQAWNTSDGFEIGDLCGGSGTLTAGANNYVVTQYFLNTTGHCSTGGYVSP